MTTATTPSTTATRPARGVVTSAFRGRFRDQPEMRRRLLERALRHAGHRRPRIAHLRRTAAGRPWYSDGAGTWNISLSHSRGVAAAAAHRFPVGVDVERLRPRRFRAIAAALDWPVEPADADTFYRAWTLWEAAFKAVGDGHRAVFEALLPNAAAPLRYAGCGGWHARWFRPGPRHWGCVVHGAPL